MATMKSAVEDLKDERVPQCLYWNVDQVANWIEDLGFPYYKVTYFMSECCCIIAVLDFIFNIFFDNC